MASFTLGVRAVRRVGGKVHVLFTDKIGVEFASLQDAKDYAHGDPLAAGSTKDGMRKLLIARYLRVDPTGANPGLIEGRSITLTDDSNTMVTVA